MIYYQSCLPVAQASSSFKHLNMHRMPTYTALTLITETLHSVAYLNVKATAYTALAYSYQIGFHNMHQC